MIASCGCLTKTPDPAYHKSECLYKQYSDILNYIEHLENKVVKMAKYDYGGGCSCGLYRECYKGCEHHPDTKKVVVIDSRVSFEDAFIAARQQKANIFEWKGARYHTKTADELEKRPINLVLKVFYE